MMRLAILAIAIVAVVAVSSESDSDLKVFEAQVARVEALLQNLQAANCASNGIDLSALSTQIFPFADTGYQYKFTPCASVADTQCSNKQGTLCQYANQGGGFHMLASWQNPTWSTIPDGIQAYFKNGDMCYNMGSSSPREVTIQFKCTAGNAGTIQSLASGSNPCSYTMVFLADAACAGSSGGGGDGGSGSPKKGLSGGSIFMIVLAVVIPIYIVGGCIYKSKRMGTSGMESCPNIDFWRALPGLVKEGCGVTFNKLRGLCGKGGGSYETVE